MPLRFFADHCVPNSVGASLSREGHDVHRLRDHLPTSAPDPQVIAKAQQLDAILVSLNGDFADIVSYPPAAYCGIISLQVRNHPETIGPIVALLIDHLARYPSETDYKGKPLVVESHRIRVRQ